MKILGIAGEFITGTPLYAWVILVFLIYQGLKHKKDRKVVLIKSFLAPAVFIVWGLTKVFIYFAYPAQTAGIYIVFAMAGMVVGFLLCSKRQKFYIIDSTIMKKGNSFSLIVNIINYLIQYGLNAYTAIMNNVAADLQFNIVYGATAGFSVGIFIGGIMNTIKSIKLLQKEKK
ncbi:MAG: hypothetical protein LBC53_03335 [Spirochaetaceae bacterium]|jgi:hypothetical protein|nr:hypothetical protein [Spirochaetaceae bacterium]